MLKTALTLLPIFILVAIGFWFLLPGKSSVLISQDKLPLPSPETEYFNEVASKLDLLENKVKELEGSNSALVSKLSILESNKTTMSSNSQLGKKSPVLLPINPGGNVNSTTWTNLTTGSVTIDPADYTGYKNAYLIINLSVNVGQGTAYAQLVNTQNTLAIIPSQVSTNSYVPVTLTSGPFQLPKGPNTYTVQLYTQVPGYPAQAGDSFLQITY